MFWPLGLVVGAGCGGNIGAVSARLYTGASLYTGIFTSGGLFRSADANDAIPKPNVAKALSCPDAVPDKNLENILSPNIELEEVLG